MHLKEMFLNTLFSIGTDKYACFTQMHIKSILTTIQNKLSNTVQNFLQHSQKKMLKAYYADKQQKKGILT